MEQITDMQMCIARGKKREAEYEQTAHVQARLVANLRKRLEEAEQAGADAAAQSVRVAASVVALQHALEPFANKAPLVPQEGDAAVQLTHAADDYRRAAKAMKAWRP